jgi:uroporphyrinogen-III synthase
MTEMEDSNGERRALVALPETRQLDVLASMLERRGVDVVRCPLIAIRDSSDDAAVVAWLKRFIAGEMDLLVCYTGEGIRRLTGFAERARLKDAFVEALGKTSLMTRGPKPARALREFGIKPEYPALAPTTPGVIETLAGIDLDGKTVGVQLYGAEPLPELMAALATQGATVDCVAPYVYASESDDAAVEVLIGQLEGREIDAIAFTSKAQVERLAAVAKRRFSVERLKEALGSTVVAAVGPVVAAELEALGVAVDVVPESDYFMKPMVSALLSWMDEKG